MCIGIKIQLLDDLSYTLGRARVHLLRFVDGPGNGGSGNTRFFRYFANVHGELAEFP